MGTDRTVMLDIGAHDGLSLDAVVDVGFDRIHSFEPMPKQFRALKRKYGKREHVSLHNFGLSSTTGKRIVYGDNKMWEASVYTGDCLGRTDETIQTECQFEDASFWLRDNVPEGAEIVAKLNCEGSEADIIESWIGSGQIWRIRHMLIAWDIRRFGDAGEQRFQHLYKVLDGIGYYVRKRWDFLGHRETDPLDYEQLLVRDWLKLRGLGPFAPQP